MISVSNKFSSKRAAFLFGTLFCLISLVTFSPGHAQERIDTGNGVVINIADRSLTKKIVVDRAQFARVGPVARVQVTLSNTSRSALQIQYRAQWFDSDGFEISTHDRWEPATVEGQTSRSVDILGNDRDASSVVVNVKAL